MSVKGMDLPMIRAAGLYDSYVTYALHDVELCAGIFKKLVVDAPNGQPEFPMQEIPILDMILRMTLEPSFVLDRDRLAQHLHSVLVAKQRALDTIGSDKTAIRQNETFADMLRAQGVDPPRKISPTTGLELYAFSKTDEEFLELESHPNVIVQALVAARLGAKSTIEETRAQRFINISNLQWPVTIRSNSMPMPVRFSGAHTHRGSGDWKLNVQNMTRDGELRKALRAPPGYKVVTVDASQIEARITALLAGQKDLLQQFENGDDVYSNFASIVYGKPINKKDHPAERFVGKTCILGLGFGMGWMKFHRQINLSKQVVISEEQAVNIVSTYRTTFSNITTLRASLNAAIPVLANGGDVMQIGPVRIEKGMIYMPGRLKMFYHELHYKDDGWVFTFAGKPKRLYGGRVLENIVQYLDRIIVFDAAIRIEHRFKQMGWGYHLAQQAHDENGYVVKDEHVEQVKAILLEEMTRRPIWGPLPLMAEVGVGDNYGEAK
jgi:DNA polymerase